MPDHQELPPPDKSLVGYVATALHTLADAALNDRSTEDPFYAALDAIKRYGDERVAFEAGKRSAPVDALALAKRFHEAYERLAPRFGYETRQDTRSFDPESANGRLMVAVCAELLPAAPAVSGEAADLSDEQAATTYYQGNSVRHIKDKAKAYGDEIMRCWFVIKDAGKHPGRTDDRLSDVLKAALARPTGDAKDAERLDWLCRQFVTVRIPMRYGSRECFMGSPDDNDGESLPWDIRAAIDAAMNTEAKNG